MVFFKLLNQVETLFLLANVYIKKEWQETQIWSLKVIILLDLNDESFLFSAYLKFFRKKCISSNVKFKKRILEEKMLNIKDEMQ